jgi:uncharacterized membrane protein HdeD (DUF308 family)
MILGILAMLAPGVTGLSMMVALGVLVLIAGLLRIFWALQTGSPGLRLAIGGLTVLCGIALIGHPLFASGVLSILLAAYFILDGISEIAMGSRIGTDAGGGWLLFGGIVSLLLGLMLWAQFPLSGAWALGILLGIKLFLVGLIMVTAGSAAQR